jgi:hypothetical protein
MLLRALIFFGSKESLADKAQGVTFVPAFAKREDISDSGDVFPLYFFHERGRNDGKVWKHFAH